MSRGGGNISVGAYQLEGLGVPICSNGLKAIIHPFWVCRLLPFARIYTERRPCSRAEFKSDDARMADSNINPWDGPDREGWGNQTRQAVHVRKAGRSCLRCGGRVCGAVPFTRFTRRGRALRSTTDFGDDRGC